MSLPRLGIIGLGLILLWQTLVWITQVPGVLDRFAERGDARALVRLQVGNYLIDHRRRVVRRVLLAGWQLLQRPEQIFDGLCIPSRFPHGWDGILARQTSKEFWSCKDALFGRGKEGIT